MPIKDKVTLSSVMDDLALWHQRYGHLNFNSLRVLKRRNMVIDLPIFDVNKNICEGCIMGKIHRLPLTKTSWRAKFPIQLVLTDLWGSSRHPSIGE